MLGVTMFGLLFTPVFYVVARAAARRPRDQPAGGQHTVASGAAASPGE